MFTRDVISVDSSDIAQVLTGVGIGLTLPQCSNAAQTVLARKDIPIGITIINFANFLGGTIFVSVSQGILSSTLVSQLSKSLPGFDASVLATSGATDLAKLVPADKVHLLQLAYNTGIVNIFYCTVGVSCLAFLASLFIEWRTVKKNTGDKVTC